MAEKSRSWPWLLLGLVAIVLSWNVADADSGPYSVQVKAVPLEQRADAVALYRRLKERGYLAYHYMTPIHGKMWVRVRVGVFATRAEADDYGRRLARDEQMPYFIDSAPAQVLAVAGTRLVMTPSGAWVQRGRTQYELFATGTRTASQMVDVAADIAPSGERIATLQDDALVIYDADSGDVVLRRDEFGSIMPRIRYSPDGRWLAFQPIRDFEGEFSLWLMSADGAEPRRLVDVTGTDRTIRSFAWHPREPKLFYVEGQAWGAVSQGGRIMLVDLDGHGSVFLEPRGEREELAGELAVRGGQLHYRLIHFDENYNHYTATPAQAEIP